MENDWIEVQEILQKLKRKAEICRYAHSCLADAACWWRRFAEIMIAVLTLLLSATVVLFYRGVFAGHEELLMFVIGIVPILILFVQTLSKTFGWAQKEEDHSLAVHVWGMWIRDTDFLLETKSDPMNASEQERVLELQKKYVYCMDKTPLIPNEKFLFYKIAFKRRQTLAKEIDEIKGGHGEVLSQLDKVEQECHSVEKKNMLANKDKAC